MLCEVCGSECWDNRQKKLDGTISAKAPDFKCKDTSCGWVKWPPKTTQTFTKPAKKTVPDEVWEKKDRWMAKESAWKTAGMVYEGTGNEEKVKEFAKIIFDDITQ